MDASNDERALEVIAQGRIEIEAIGAQARRLFETAYDACMQGQMQLALQPLRELIDHVLDLESCAMDTQLVAETLHAATALLKRQRDEVLAQRDDIAAELEAREYDMQQQVNEMLDEELALAAEEIEQEAINNLEASRAYTVRQLTARLRAQGRNEEANQLRGLFEMVSNFDEMLETLDASSQVSVDAWLAVEPARDDPVWADWHDALPQHVRLVWLSRQPEHVRAEYRAWLGFDDVEG